MNIRKAMKQPPAATCNEFLSRERKEQEGDTRKHEARVCEALIGSRLLCPFLMIAEKEV